VPVRGYEQVGPAKCQSCVRIRPVEGLAPALGYLGLAVLRMFLWWSIRASDVVGTVQLAARPLAKGVMIDAVDRFPIGSQATPRSNRSRRSTIPVFCTGECRYGGDRWSRGSR